MTQTHKPIELYYWPTPNGWKISIMLEECGLPYTLHGVDINAGQQFEPAFLAISPNNRMPAIVDPDGPDASPSRCSSGARSFRLRTGPASVGRRAGSAKGRRSPTSRIWRGGLLARPAVQRGLALDVPGRRPRDHATDEEARKLLFGQRAR